MSIKFLKLLLILTLFLNIACSNTRYLAAKVQASDISELEFFKPISLIAFVPQENDAVIDDSLILNSETIIAQEIFKIKSHLPHLNPYIIRDEKLEAKIHDEIYKAWKTTDAYNSIDVLPIPPTVDKLLENKGKRFGLAIYYTGFVRSDESSAWAKKRRILNSTLSLAALATVRDYITSIHIYSAKKSRVALSAMIFDAQTNKIIFFNQSVALESDPLDRQLISKSLDEIFLGYFEQPVK